MTPMKVGILGVSGHFIKRILKPLQKSSLIDVYAISSRSKDKAKNAAEKFDIPHYFTSYEELLKDKTIELVFIPLPNNLHAEWIKKCADYGKHILCEKPITLNAQEAIECINYAKNKNVYIMEAFMYKFHPQWKHILELIQIGEIGKINTIHTTFGYNNPDPENIRNIKKLGGGGLMDIGCYAISVPRYLLQAEPKRVISLMNFDDVFQTDILTSAILDFGYTRATFNVSTKTFPYQKVKIYGTHGIITVQIPFNTFNDVPAKITINTSVGIREINFDPVDQYQLQFEEFINAIRNKIPSPVPIEDAINNMKVIDAIVKSGKTNKWEIIE